MSYSVFILIFGFLISFVNTTRVHLSTGTIEGKAMNATYSPLGNQSAIVFLGIPFVQPPLGDLRFRRPRPPIPWKGVLETKSYKPACLSNMTKTYKNNVGGPISEDCLYLNVFTNEYCMQTKNCSVMIVVHGGGFLFESASALDPQILINNFVGQGRNIVTVSVNYRLGVFGFGHFNEVNGERNNGLFDLLASVKWVRREIGKFGGSKERITLAGHSAGGGMVTVFTSSPLTKGLINQQIIMSGPLPNVSKQSNSKAMVAVTKRVGCLPEKAQINKEESTKKTDKIYDCLRKVSGKDLLDAQLYILENSTFWLGCPTIDGEFNVDYADKLFGQKAVYQINTLMGTTTAELRDSIYLIEPQNAKRKSELLKNLCEHIAYEIYKEPEQFVEKCVTHYSNGTEAQELSDDMEFYSQAVRVANAFVSNQTKVFMYSYAYSGAGPAFNKYMLNLPSPHHSEDLIYVFGTHRGVMAPKDYVIERIYSGMFADFVNSGDPSPSKEQPWLQYTPEKREHFLIDFDENFEMPGMRENYYPEALKFWSTAGEKSYSEEWSPSYDVFIATNLIAPITSHLNNVSDAVDKTLEQTEILFSERENFLQELKFKRKLKLKLEQKQSGNQRKMAARSGDVPKQIGLAEQGEKEGGGGINILLTIFAGTLLVGILYVTTTHFCMHHRSREGYQLLK